MSDSDSTIQKIILKGTSLPFLVTLWKQEKKKKKGKQRKRACLYICFNSSASFQNWTYGCRMEEESGQTDYFKTVITDKIK